MSKIRIKNFGPIKLGYTENGGWLAVKKVTMFIGNQGSGKSVVAKLISTFTWIEKSLTRGDSNVQELTKRDNKLNPWKYHRLENYFHIIEKINLSEIEYIGDSFEILFIKGDWFVKKVETGNYRLPQIMYVPAERNLLSYLTNLNFFRGTITESLADFLTEFNRAKSELTELIDLPINNVALEYSKQRDKLSIKGADYTLHMSESSSGFQSLVPLFLVSRYLANKVTSSDRNQDSKMRIEQRELFRKEVNFILENPTLTEEQKRIYITELSKKFNNAAFINVVEEPEQNLFPSSQRLMLNSLLAFNNMNEDNKLIMTTHSPYLLVYLTLSVEANRIKGKVKTEELKSKLNDIVPLNSTVNGNDLVVYQLNELDGTIEKLKDYKGLPSDENYLNEGLADSNDQFSKLLDLEDLCR